MNLAEWFEEESKRIDEMERNHLIRRIESMKPDENWFIDVNMQIPSWAEEFCDKATK